MPYNFSSYKIQVFPGINDDPVPASSTKGNNASDLIAKYNALIDALQTALNASAPGGASLSCTVILPSDPYIASMDVFYLNRSQSITLVNGVYLGADNLIASYVIGTDVELGATLDLSALFTEFGVGFYYFIFRRADNTPFSTSRIFPFSFLPRGTGYLSNGMQVTIYDNFGSPQPNDVVPVAVTASSGAIELTLSNEEFVIG